MLLFSHIANNIAKTNYSLIFLNCTFFWTFALWAKASAAIIFSFSAAALKTRTGHSVVNGIVPVLRYWFQAEASLLWLVICTEDESSAQLLRTKSDAGVLRRGQRRSPSDQRKIRRHRFSINGHFYNHKVKRATENNSKWKPLNVLTNGVRCKKVVFFLIFFWIWMCNAGVVFCVYSQTAVFTPAFGSVTNVRINSCMTTPQVLRVLLNKFKIENSPDDFAIYLVHASGGECRSLRSFLLWQNFFPPFSDNMMSAVMAWFLSSERVKLKRSDYPLVLRVIQGPCEQVCKIFLMEEDLGEEVTYDVNQHILFSLSI